MDPMKGGLNLYTYAWNNPLSWIDPFGLFSITSITGGVEGEYCFPVLCPVCYICLSLSGTGTGFCCCDDAVN